MPHYRDGTPAKIGDVVKGKGYNQTKENGCVGIVTRLIGKQEQCNLTVTYARLVEVSEVADQVQAQLVRVEIEPGVNRTMALVFERDYGETAAFEKVEA